MPPECRRHRARRCRAPRCDPRQQEVVNCYHVRLPAMARAPPISAALLACGDPRPGADFIEGEQAACRMSARSAETYPVARLVQVPARREVARLADHVPAFRRVQHSTSSLTSGGGSCWRYGADRSAGAIRPAHCRRGPAPQLKPAPDARRPRPWEVKLHQQRDPAPALAKRVARLTQWLLETEIGRPRPDRRRPGRPS